jgi:hypothetical protein
MTRTAVIVALGLGVSTGTVARAETPAPQAYTLKAGGTMYGREWTVTIVRDGARERVERTIGQHVMASLYDFAAQRVYWLGYSGAGSCSSGHYLSARAPVGDDPVTGTGEQLSKMAQGRPRRAAGSGTVAGLPARIEEFVGGKKPAGKDAPPLPLRVWLSERDGHLLKLEVAGPDGKPVTPFEVTQLTFGKPAGAPLEPPSPCVATDSEMDDSGTIRGRATASVGATVGGSADLGAAAPGATAGATPGRTVAPGAKPRAAGALAKIEAMVLNAVEQPEPGKCGRKLELTGTISVDGPARIKYAFRSSVGGLRFGKNESGTTTIDAAGHATVVTEAVLQRSAKGTLRLQAMVLGTNGHDGRLEASPAVPFEVTCAAR